MKAGVSVRNRHTGKVGVVVDAKPMYRGDTSVSVAWDGETVPCKGNCGCRVPRCTRTHVDALVDVTEMFPPDADAGHETLAAVESL